MCVCVCVHASTMPDHKWYLKIRFYQIGSSINEELQWPIKQVNNEKSEKVFLLTASIQEAGYSQLGKFIVSNKFEKPSD